MNKKLLITDLLQATLKRHSLIAQQKNGGHLLTEPKVQMNLVDITPSVSTTFQWDFYLVGFGNCYSIFKLHYSLTRRLRKTIWTSTSIFKKTCHQLLESVFSHENWCRTHTLQTHQCLVIEVHVSIRHKTWWISSGGGRSLSRMIDSIHSIIRPSLS